MLSHADMRPSSSWCVRAHFGDFRLSARRTPPSRGSCHSASTTCHPRCNARQTLRPRTLTWTWGCQVKETVVSMPCVARSTHLSQTHQMSFFPTLPCLPTVRHPARCPLFFLRLLHQRRLLPPGCSLILLFTLLLQLLWQCRCRVATSGHRRRPRDGWRRSPRLSRLNKPLLLVPPSP